MKKRVDPVGRLLLRAGVLDEETLADVLDQQRHTLPFASLAYVLGHVEEEPLTRALSKHWGVPGIVLSRCIINLRILHDVPGEIALKYGLMPVLEDASRVFVAVKDPTDTDVLRELGFIKGKAVVPHVGLSITIARTIRRAFAALAHGEHHFYGDNAVGREGPDGPGRMLVVSDVDDLPGEITRGDSLYDAAPEDITKELLEGGDEVADVGRGDTWRGDHALLAVTATPTPVATRPARAGDESTTGGELRSALAPRPASADLELDSQARGTPLRVPTAANDGPPRLLIVDDDFVTRHLLEKVFARDYMVDTAASGMEAIKRLRAQPPDLVVLDLMLPEIDGFQICRSIKSSRKYSHIPVVFLSAAIESPREVEDILARYGAEAYFDKPIDVERLRAAIAALLGARAAHAPEGEDTSFEHSLDLYRAGKVDEAIDALRAGLAHDPLSTRHHFVLANLLQKKNQIYEAIDEYEATVNLKPDYFPALSRLAYLYYKKGFSAKAIETWRRSLPHCPDTTLRQNIEQFMRKLIADMQTGGDGFSY